MVNISFLTVCRSDEFLFGAHCVNVVEKAAAVTGAQASCKKSRNSYAAPFNMNADKLALLSLSIFLHRETDLSSPPEKEFIYTGRHYETTSDPLCWTFKATSPRNYFGTCPSTGAKYSCFRPGKIRCI